MPDSGDKQMSFLGHLEELRWTVVWIIGATVAVAAAAWFITDDLISFFSNDLAAILGRVYGLRGDSSLHVFDVSEAFSTKFRIALLVGLLGALPLSVYKVWRFVSPGLFARERRLVGPLILLSIVLFYAGVAFAYFVMVKLTVAFLFKMTPPSVVATVRLGSYVSFITKFCMTFGLVFQMPMVLALLAWLGIVPARTLKRTWRYAIVVIIIIAAVLTPPDVVSQTLMAVPMLLLYWIGYLLARSFEKRGGRRVSS